MFEEEKPEANEEEELEVNEKEHQANKLRGRTAEDEDEPVNQEEVPEDDEYDKEDESRFECAECDSKFRWNSGLTAQVRQTPMGKFKCTQCSNKFQNKIMLTGHIEPHKYDEEDQSRFECAKCDSKFRWNS